MSSLENLLKAYDYELPPELIAQEPATPRDSARLLVYDRTTKCSSMDTFRHLPSYLPEGAVLVFNQTKVIPARFTVTKESGGKAEFLYTGHDQTRIFGLCNKKLPLGSTVNIAGAKTPLQLSVQACEAGTYTLLPGFAAARILGILDRAGTMPLPPYIKHTRLSEQEKRVKYQTIFAKAGNSVAAPTASLHFTQRLLSALKRQGTASRYVTLNVGLGTFAPLKSENVSSGKLHLENYQIDAKTADFLNAAKKEGRPIIAVGTTVVRTLESAATGKRLTRLSGATDLFIQEGYRFRFVDGMITNFHVPRSSLLMLVSTFAGRQETLQLYRAAMEERFQFYSFGDGMLIL